MIPVRPLLAIALACAMSLAPPLALGQDFAREAGPLSRFYPHRDTYLGLNPDQRSHFRLAYVIASQDGVPPDEIEMWYDRAGERVSLDIDPLGRIGHRPDPQVLEDNPGVWINQPDGGMSLSLQFEAVLDGDGRYPVEDLELALGQANHAIREAAGVAALFTPGFRSVIFIFDGPAPRAEAVMADGSRTDLIVQENRVILRPRHRSMRHLVRVELGGTPQRILLES